MEQQQIIQQTMMDQQQTDQQPLIGLEGIAMEYLGSGYDVCGEYADGVSIKKKLFDLSRVPKKDIRQLPNRTSDFYSVAGETVETYQKSLTMKAGVSGAYKLFSGSVETSFSSGELTITESSYVTIELFMRYETWKLQATSTEYMYPDVLKDFEKKDGKWLIEQYGGGVLMGMDIGGRWMDNMAVSKFYRDSMRNVVHDMKASYASLAEGHGSTMINNCVKTHKAIASRQVNIIGGEPHFAPWDIEKWQASVEKKPAFMDFTSDGLVMIWELFPQYKEKLQKGFDEYLKEHQLDIKKRSIIHGFYMEGTKYADDSGSGSHQNVSLYKPTTANNYKYVGVNGNKHDILVLEEASGSSKFGALLKPLKWHPVWNDRGSGHHSNYSCWMPVGPPDYVALGVYCRFGVGSQNPPSDDEAKGLVVVHKSLVEECGFAQDLVWNDNGSGARYDLTLGRLPHKALWPYRSTDPNCGELPSKYTLKKEYLEKNDDKQQTQTQQN